MPPRRHSPAARKRPAARRLPPRGAVADLGGGVTVERDVVFTLRDGTRLLSDHYFPPGWPASGPAPTLLVRQPYGKEIATTVAYAQPEWFARHGYNVVVQDVRGRGASGGRFYPFRHEADDGAATVDWVARRPECNGRVGMYGFSYQGLTQLLAAARRPPALRCLAPAQTAGDLYHGWFYHHGALRLAGAMGWGAQLLRGDAHRLGLAREAGALDTAWTSLRGLYARAPYGAAPELTARALPRYFRDWVSHRTRDDYWAALDIGDEADRIDLPALHLWGWFDPYLHGSALLYDQLREQAGSPFAREHQYLVGGPWVHIPWSRQAGETDFGPAAELDTDALLLRWFNHWLKDTGEFRDEPKVRLFALGDNRWHFPKTWPGYRESVSAVLRLHLRSQGRANSSRGDGRLETAPPPGDEPRDSVVWEPDTPVQAPGPDGAPGQFSQTRIEALNNVLVYTSEPLGHRVHCCGPPRLELHAASSAPAADWFAKLVRVTADGRALNVCHAIARGGWLFGGASPAPDTVARWQFPLEPTSCVFAPGERIRLELSPGAFPLYDRSPGSEASPERAGPMNWRTSRQQVLHTAARPSRLDLPLVE